MDLTATLATELADWPGNDCAVTVVGPDAQSATHSRGDEARVYGWASVTKIVASLAVLRSVERGTIDLDDEVGPATLRHLLAHASGLAFDGTEQMATPGTRRIYSNTGINLACDYAADEEGISVVDLLLETVARPLGMTNFGLPGPAAHGGVGTIADLGLLTRELLSPKLINAETHELARTVAFPGLGGVLPGFGRQVHNDWGLGWEIRDHKSPHWTSAENSPETFGHFGQSGSFLWIDPRVGIACAALSDTPFDAWAADRWPRLSTAVLATLR